MSDAQNTIKRIDRIAWLPAFAKRPLFIAWTLGRDLHRCDLIKQASAMAYVTLLSLVPSLAAVFCVVSIFTPMLGEDSAFISKLRQFVVENLASGSSESVIAYIDRLLANLDLASIGWSSFAGLLATLVLLLRQIEGALNRIWLVRKGRNAFTRFMYFWTFLTLGIAGIAMAVGLSSGFDFDALTSVQESAEAHSRFFGSFTAWLYGCGFFFFMYKIVPNCGVRWKNALLGAAISAFLFHQAGRFYALFVRDFSNYQTLYGALAALPMFLMWLYIAWLIILLGAVISWRLQQGFPSETEEDTLDAGHTPLERLRNVQLRAWMPVVTLIAIYTHYQKATGYGLTRQDLSDRLKIPIGWITDAIDALETMGYVVAGRTEESTPSAYFPAFPAESLKIAKVRTDLQTPVDEWLGQWQPDLPVDVNRALHLFARPGVSAAATMNLAEAIGG